jgi:translocation and assembly module TamB
MSVDLVADSLPLDLVPQFTDMVSQVHGRAVGKVSMRGTLRRPVLVGAMTLDHGEAVLTTTGAKFESIGATVRMANDTVYVDSVAAWAKGPLRLRGTVAVGNWREPTLNLYFLSSGAQLMNNQQAELRIDAGLALTGPFTKPYLSGAATLVQGVVYAPEATGRHLIGAGDPALFNVLDTADVSDRDLFPTSSPFMENLRIEIAVAIHRDVWVRNREANVEVYTDDPLTIEENQQAFQLTGVVSTDRGEYTFLGKRFQIKRGSAMFIGTPDLNPTLQITGEYQVQAGRGTLSINVLIGGTVSKPKLSLESDAQPPKTQSELLSLLAFGQSSTSLSTSSSSNSSSIAGSAATMDLFGVGAQMAVKRLASTALGVVVDQVQVQASRGLGTDYFNITPADVPTTGATTSGLTDFVRNTRVEAGKYINSRTFVSVQEQAYRPGLAIEHRTANGWRFNASLEPRVLLGVPTLDLTQQLFPTKTSIGGFILREWRF